MTTSKYACAHRKPLATGPEVPRTGRQINERAAQAAPAAPIATGFQCSCVTTLTVTAGTAIQVTCPNCGGVKFVCPAAKPDLSSVESWLREQPECKEAIERAELCGPFISRCFDEAAVLALLTRMRDREAKAWRETVHKALKRVGHGLNDSEITALRGQSGEAE